MPVVVVGRRRPDLRMPRTTVFNVGSSPSFVLVFPRSVIVFIIISIISIITPPTPPPSPFFRRFRRTVCGQGMPEDKGGLVRKPYGRKEDGDLQVSGRMLTLPEHRTRPFHESSNNNARRLPRVLRTCAYSPYPACPGLTVGGESSRGTAGAAFPSKRTGFFVCMRLHDCLRRFVVLE